MVDDKRSSQRLKPVTQRLSSAFALLLFCRALSAWYNPVNDCDEVYNYWEPLHFLTYGSGMQTWEYSAEFALRSYWYLLLHKPAVLLSALVLHFLKRKWMVFYGTKLFLGTASAVTDTLLYRAVGRSLGPSIANLLLLFLCASTGMFISATSFLPSSFAMYMVTGAASGVLEGKTSRVIIFSTLCVTWGWPVAGVAVLPFALWILLQPKLFHSICVLFFSLFASLLPLVLADRYYYGKWTNALWNFVKYNVVGGGDSALYGTESSSFYLRNGLLNLNFLLPLALLAPICALAAPGGKLTMRRIVTSLLPIWFWFSAITLLPHKEERFLYVVYPLVCLGGAVSLRVLGAGAAKCGAAIFGSAQGKRVASILTSLVLALFFILSISRTLAIVQFYGAPMRIYTHLPQRLQRSNVEVPVCVGSEWHRFPSSFFLPTETHNLQFLKSGFTGLLPRPFATDQGGTAASSPYFNDRNKEEPANAWTSDARCAYLVDLEEPGMGTKGSQWIKLHSLPFVLAHKSPSLIGRTLYIPWYSWKRNAVAQYTLYGRKSTLEQEPSLLQRLSESKAVQGRPF